MDSRLRGNDDCVSVSVIPAKAGIHWLVINISYPNLLRSYR